ncbi:hypothetical protein MHTCC0001_07230 [Flavobacteriaceae bacterium MHTCC 0001]
MIRALVSLYIVTAIIGCGKPIDKSYKTLINNLREQTGIIELSTNNGNSRLIVSPFHQGKILASTNRGLEADYIGWVNKEAVEDTSKGKDIGGEERLWLAPLGSQYSFYYRQIKPLHEDNWLVPNAMADVAYEVESIEESSVSMSKTMQLTNFIGTVFNFKVDRNIKLFTTETITDLLKFPLSSTTHTIGYETKHKLTNLDTVPWTKQTGLVGLWSAGMFQGADDAVVIIPIKNNADIDDIYEYFDPLDATRLQLKNNTLLFKGDAKHWSKIGVPPQFAPDIFGAYIPSKQRLTIVTYKKENDSLYSNSFVEVMREPYKGEAIPIYNHWEDFFELESNAPLKELQPNETTSHWHRVYHFSDSEAELNKIAKRFLGVDLNKCNFIL